MIKFGTTRIAHGYLEELGPLAKPALPKLQQMLDAIPLNAHPPHIQKVDVYRVIQAIQ